MMLYRQIFTVPVIVLALLMGGCIDGLTDSLGGGDSESSSESDLPSASSANTQERIATIQSLGFETVSDELWDDKAVRNVLHTFAYGGHATDEQIAIWADMSPEAAIVEMLTFDDHNLKLSPVSALDYDGLDKREGTLRGLAEFWSSDDPDNGINIDDRIHYFVAADPEAAPRAAKIWVRAATSRGLNPFRQKIGLWETNYHMVANLDSSGVNELLIIDYYDAIMEALESDLPYQDVISMAATSAAIAVQYGHFKNKYRRGVCLCNEDFAREYYQLFFGVLGDYNPDYHETVTIKNTAKALTDFSLGWAPDFGHTSNIQFGTEFHYPGILEILESEYWGGSAQERIDPLSQHVILHPESLNNLPVKIIADLADDNLNDTKIDQLRNVWAGMQHKSLLNFLRAYAVSTIFHSEDRIKHLSSIDRHMLLFNKVALSNEEGYLDLYRVSDYKKEDVDVFRPSHNVFGGQTGLEAASSADVFRNSYNNSTQYGLKYRVSETTKYGRPWVKDWTAVVPVGRNGSYVVQDVAEWLWNRFIGDGLKNFGSLERANIYAFLASGDDLIQLASPDDLDRVITAQELETESALASLVDSLAAQSMSLDSVDAEQRRTANERIGQAVNFIAATPYIFVQEGR